MKKVTIGAQTQIYPMPVLLVGANVDGSANYMVAAWGGIANSDPPMLSVSLRHSRHTLKGIRQLGTFSVNIPSTDLVREADYSGVARGSKGDKSPVNKFKTFYGKLGSAPLIEQCPVNLECKAMHLLDLGSHVMVVGRIEEVHVSEDCLSDGKPDAAKIKPFCYIHDAREYRAMGPVIGKAFSAGLELKPKGS